MDPEMTALVVSGVKAATGSASQEAGKQAWKGLVALVRRARHEPEAVVEPSHGEALVPMLVEAAGRDPQFAADLRGWLELVAQLQLVGRVDPVSNTIRDSARTGDVVQARDVSGSINFR